MSDGIERFEIPIWSEMYEEKSDLLQENKLLYAILQIERKEGSLQLSCRSLEDLNAMDESKIQASDTLYDRLKMQTRHGEPKWKKEKQNQPKETAPKEKEEMKHLILSIDSDKIAFSEILALKKLFRSFPGKSTVDIQFFHSHKQKGTLSIGQEWGVQPNAEFLNRLKAFLSIKIKDSIS